MAAIGNTEFLDKWDDLEVSLHEDKVGTRRFFFEFVMRTLAVIWNDLTLEEVDRIHRSISNFFSLSDKEAKDLIADLRVNLPNHRLLGNQLFVKSEIVNLLVEISTQYVCDSAHTYGEEISIIPESLNLPKDIPLDILKGMNNSHSQ